VHCVSWSCLLCSLERVPVIVSNTFYAGLSTLSSFVHCLFCSILFSEGDVQTPWALQYQVRTLIRVHTNERLYSSKSPFHLFDIIKRPFYCFFLDPSLPHTLAFIHTLWTWRVLHSNFQRIHEPNGPLDQFIFSVQGRILTLSNKVENNF
jgi:hypothetical protein